MSNFSFLADIPEFTSFADSCVHAEEIFKDSPASCVAASRAAMEKIVKWLYRHDQTLRNLQMSKRDLFSLIENKAFKHMIPYKIYSNMHKIRMMANEVLHSHHFVSNQQGLYCLRALFDLVQWVDKNYGSEYHFRKFDKDSVPQNDNALKTGLKYGAAALAGAVILALGSKLSSNNTNDEKNFSYHGNIDEWR